MTGTVILRLANLRLAKTLATAGVLMATLSPHPAWAQGGGTPDPGAIPTLQALRIEVNALDQRFLALTATVETADLVPLKHLADLLARIDARLAATTVGGGSPDPSESSLLNYTLLHLRSETAELRSHVAQVLADVAGNPVFDQITVTKTLQFMRATARMIIARVEYALPVTLAPPSPPVDW
jgi:hypothetical protein